MFLQTRFVRVSCLTVVLTWLALHSVPLDEQMLTAMFNRVRLLWTTVTTWVSVKLCILVS